MRPTTRVRHQVTRSRAGRSTPADRFNQGRQRWRFARRSVLVTAGTCRSWSSTSGLPPECKFKPRDLYAKSGFGGCCRRRSEVTSEIVRGDLRRIHARLRPQAVPSDDLALWSENRRAGHGRDPVGRRFAARNSLRDECVAGLVPTSDGSEQQCGDDKSHCDRERCSLTPHVQSHEPIVPAVAVECKGVWRASALALIKEPRIRPCPRPLVTRLVRRVSPPLARPTTPRQIVPATTCRVALGRDAWMLRRSCDPDVGCSAP